MEFDVGARLRELRTAAGLSQRDLADRAGVTHGLISMIERNRNSPSVASLRKILGGIPTTMSAFFNEEEATNDKIFFAANELTDLTSRIVPRGRGAAGRMAFRQVGDACAHDLQILHERYEPGADTGPTMLEHSSREGGVIISGEIELTVGDQVRRLKAGEAYLFDSRIPHRFRNVGKEPCEVVSACTPPYL